MPDDIQEVLFPSVGTESEIEIDVPYIENPSDRIMWLKHEFLELGCSHNLAEVIAMMLVDYALDDKIVERLNVVMLREWNHNSDGSAGNYLDYAYAACLITNAERKFGKKLMEKVNITYEGPTPPDTDNQQ